MIHDRSITWGMTVAMPSTKAAGSRISSRTSPVATLVILTRRKRARRSAVLASSPPDSPSHAGHGHLHNHHGMDVMSLAIQPFITWSPLMTQDWTKQSSLVPTLRYRAFILAHTRANISPASETGYLLAHINTRAPNPYNLDALES